MGERCFFFFRGLRLPTCFSVPDLYESSTRAPVPFPCSGARRLLPVIPGPRHSAENCLSEIKSKKKEKRKGEEATARLRQDIASLSTSAGPELFEEKCRETRREEEEEEVEGEREPL